MEDQKRLFIAIILSIVVMVGWEWIFANKTPVKRNTQIQQTTPGHKTAESGNKPGIANNAGTTGNSATAGKTADYSPGSNQFGNGSTASSKGGTGGETCSWRRGTPDTFP